jgi:hypothetical protein
MHTARICGCSRLDLRYPLRIEHYDIVVTAGLAVAVIQNTRLCCVPAWQKLGDLISDNIFDSRTGIEVIDIHTAFMLYT